MKYPVHCESYVEIPDPPEVIDETVYATGDPVVDTQTLMNAIHTSTHGRPMVRRVAIDTRKSPLALQSHVTVHLSDAWLYPAGSSHARINLIGTTTIAWGTYRSWGSIEAASARCLVSSDGLSLGFPDGPWGALSAGNVISIQSDDVLDVVPHIRGGTNRPQEIARIAAIMDNEVFLDRPLRDRYTTNARCTLLDVVRGGGMEGIDFSGSDNGDSDLLCGIAVYRATGWRARNIIMKNTGSLNTYLCDDVLIEDLQINGQQKSNAIYGVASVCTSRLRINGFRGYGCRHMFTSGGYDDGNGNRYGTVPENVIEKFDWVMNETQSGAAVLAGDTHAEGLGITFRDGTITYAGNNDYNNATQGTLYGMHGRSRELLIERVKFQGDRDHSQKHVGVLLDGDRDTTIRDCDFRDLIIGCCIRQVGDKPGAPACHRVTLQGNRFRNMRNEAILINGGSGHVISRNEIDGAGRSKSGYFGSQKAAITLNDYGNTGISDIVVRNNTIVKHPSAEKAIWLHPSLNPGPPTYREFNNLVY